MGLFSRSKRSDEDIKKDNKNNIEKEITRKEIEIGNLKNHIRANDARIENCKEYNRNFGRDAMGYSTLEWENKRDEKRIADLENQINDLRKRLLRL